MSEVGQPRHFGRRPVPSGLPRSTDIARPPRHVGLVPTGDIRHWVYDSGEGSTVNFKRPSSTLHVLKVASRLSNSDHWGSPSAVMNDDTQKLSDSATSISGSRPTRDSSRRPCFGADRTCAPTGALRSNFRTRWTWRLQSACKSALI
jgi:hypothetical protein